MSQPFETPPTLTVNDAAAPMSAFLPIVILGLVLLAWFAFQAVQLRLERDAMRDAMTTQDKPVQDSKKLRDALDAIARGTAQLADAGNPNARLVVDELKKRGVTISPNASTGVDPAPVPSKQSP